LCTHIDRKIPHRLRINLGLSLNHQGLWINIGWELCRQQIYWDWYERIRTNREGFITDIALELIISVNEYIGILASIRIVVDEFSIES